LNREEADGRVEKVFALISIALRALRLDCVRSCRRQLAASMGDEVEESEG